MLIARQFQKAPFTGLSFVLLPDRAQSPLSAIAAPNLPQAQHEFGSPPSFNLRQATRIRSSCRCPVHKLNDGPALEDNSGLCALRLFALSEILQPTLRPAKFPPELIGTTHASRFTSLICFTRARDNEISGNGRGSKAAALIILRLCFS